MSCDDRQSTVDSAGVEECQATWQPLDRGWCTPQCPPLASYTYLSTTCPRYLRLAPAYTTLTCSHITSHNAAYSLYYQHIHSIHINSSHCGGPSLLHSYVRRSVPTGPAQLHNVAVRASSNGLCSYAQRACELTVRAKPRAHIAVCCTYAVCGSPRSWICLPVFSWIVLQCSCRTILAHVHIVNHL